MQPPLNQDLTAAEIDAKMARSGFPEIQFLWDHFKTLKVRLQEIDEVSLDRSRARHMGTFVSRPRLTSFLLCIAVLLLALTQPWRFVLEGIPRDLHFVLDPHAIAAQPAQFAEGVAISFFIVVLVCFTAVVILRTWIHPWRRIAALDLASMLKRRSYRDWLDHRERSRQVAQRLLLLGVNERWDDATYKIRYRSSERGIENVPIEAPHQIIQNTLREILGYKEERQFHPGRYVDSLKEGKAGVTRFIGVHQEQIQLNKSGLLPLPEGLYLLRDLLENYLHPETSGYRCVEGAIRTLQQPDFLSDGVVEAQIWQRDPWNDLTHQKDFYSSASLRRNTLKDALERRTKGVLGPFGYLRNKSITALDCRTSEGRRVRARMAAATYRTHSGQQRLVLFVDGVEGRFDVKPKLIKTAIENYAKAAGFRAVFYFRHPLNKVPERFVRFVASVSAAPEELFIEFVDHTSREYLDSFGYPFEPLEYAIPRGKVIGYFVSIDSAEEQESSSPGWLKLLINRGKKKYILHVFVAIPLLFVIWQVGNIAPWGLAPLGFVVGALFAYQAYLERRAVRVAQPRPLGTSRRPMTDEITDEPFLVRIRSEINANPEAVKMSYPSRLDGKIQRLREYFPIFHPQLQPFLEEVMFNVSIKEGDLTNVLKFLGNIKDDLQRERTRQVFPILWARSNPLARNDGLSEDRGARERLKSELFEKIDVVRELAKAADLKEIQPSNIKRMHTALQLDAVTVLKMIAVSPLILRGLTKPPRPLYGCVLPVASGLTVAYGMLLAVPAISTWILYGIVMLFTAVGTYFICTRLKFAPGILYYRMTREYFSRLLEGSTQKSKFETAMESLGIDIGEYEKEKIYENKEQGTRIIVRNKKTVEGAVRFLTSSEAIDSCIALQNFVSWALPSLLSDDGIMLADIFHKGSHPRHYHRAQMWMVAAEEDGMPVLTVNSLEFNEEGAKYIDLLLPEAIKVLQDVAVRGGFKKVFIGITEFGRAYLDRHFSQGVTRHVIKKIHAPEAGYRYYFDAYVLKRSASGGRIHRGYVYARKRGPLKRAYAIIFGCIEFIKGNRAKAAAFFESFANANNFWEIPLSDLESTPTQ